MNATSAKARNLTLVHLLWAGLIAAAAAVVLTNLNELGRIGGELGSARPGYLLAAGCVFGLYMLNYAEFYCSTFRAAGLRGTRLRFLLVTSASHFINIVSKSSGFGGLPLYLAEGSRQGDIAARVTIAYLAAYVLGYAAYVCVLVTALALLASRHVLTTPEMIAAAAVLIGVAVLTAAVFWGLQSEARLVRLALLAAAPVNAVARRLGKTPLVSVESAERMSSELYAGVRSIIGRPRGFVRPFGHALGVELLSVLMLYFVALSLHAGVGFQVALAGYAIALLFTIVSITPAGLGFVEVSLTVFFVSFGVSRSNALAITLAYRFFEFWLPIAVGALALFALRISDAGQRAT